MKKIHNTFISEELSKPIGPYTHCGVVESSANFLYSSGQIGIFNSGEFAGDDIKSQTKQTLENLQTLLKSKGLSLNNVIKTTCYLTSMSNFNDFNEIYSQYFDENKPARTTVAVSGLPKNALIEIELIAVY